MKTILYSALTIIIIVLVYFLFFYNSSSESSRITESKRNSVNAKNVSNKAMLHRDETIGNKLSMKQIDSITALSNYNFTIQNYSKDVVPVQTAEQKNKKM
jgi:hypothetical protein